MKMIWHIIRQDLPVKFVPISIQLLSQPQVWYRKCELIITYKTEKTSKTHCVKSVQIRSYFWSVFSCIRTEYGEILYLSVFSPNAGKYRPEMTPYLDTFRAVTLTQYIPVSFIHLFPIYKISIVESRPSELEGKTSSQQSSK